MYTNLLVTHTTWVNYPFYNTTYTASWWSNLRPRNIGSIYLSLTYTKTNSYKVLVQPWLPVDSFVRYRSLLTLFWEYYTSRSVPLNSAFDLAVLTIMRPDVLFIIYWQLVQGQHFVRDIFGTKQGFWLEFDTGPNWPNSDFYCSTSSIQGLYYWANQLNFIVN